jgi:integrase/recombinase XerD
LSSIPVEHKPVIEFLIETGLRPAEVRALKWGVVEEDHIQIRAGFSNGIFREITKTKNQWPVPMLNRVKAILNRVPRSLRTDFIFCYGNGNPYGEKKLRRLWHTACKKAGVDKITLYQGTRHSFATQSFISKIPLEYIGSMMGHVNTETTRKYAHLNKITALREAFEE